MTNIDDQAPPKPVVGLALGSGSARGWAHIGVIQGLEEIGVQPQVVAGTSIGALVGGAYVTNTLNEFADWVQSHRQGCVRAAGYQSVWGHGEGGEIV